MIATLLHPTKARLNQRVELGEMEHSPRVIICGGQVFVRGTVAHNARGVEISARYSQATFVDLDGAADKVAG